MTPQKQSDKIGSEIEARLLQSNLSQSEKKKLTDQLAKYYSEKLLGQVGPSTSTNEFQEADQTPQKTLLDTQSKQTPVIRKQETQKTTRPKHRGWRSFNTVLILCLFFAPWFESCFGTTNGYEAVAQSSVYASDVIKGEQDFLWSFAFFYIGLLSFLLYVAISLVTVLRKGDVTQRQSWWKLSTGLLAMSIVGMFSPIYFAVTIGGIEDVKSYLWGYWATWAGLISCILLEYINYKTVKT